MAQNKTEGTIKDNFSKKSECVASELLAGRVSAALALIGDAKTNVNDKAGDASLAPIQIAMARGNRDVILALLARPDIDLSVTDGFGRTVADFLVHVDDVEVHNQIVDALYPKANIGPRPSI